MRIAAAEALAALDDAADGIVRTATAMIEDRASRPLHQARSFTTPVSRRAMAWSPSPAARVRIAALHRRRGAGPVHQRPRLSDLVDLEAHVAIVAHEAVEIGLAQHQEPAIGQRPDVGLAGRA